MERKIEFFKHNINDEDIAEANSVLRSIFLTTGPMVAEFEQKFGHFLGVPEAVGLTSCTGAIHLALLKHGIGPGDEVITTPMTFVATASAIMESGATPIFVDVCPKSALLLPEDVEKAITSKTKGILPVHLFGRMVDMRGFSHLARKKSLVLIEDSAHCIEGSRDGIQPGQLSNAACFSFYATKGMTCGEGGALVCNSSEDAQWYRSARHHGISKNAASRYAEKYQHWDMEMMGWKYNMDDIQAALLVRQIDRVREYRKIREEREKLYRSLLRDVKGLEFLQFPGKNEVSAHHLMVVLLPKTVSRDFILNFLQDNQVGCAVNYRAIHTLSFFREKLGFAPSDFPVALDIGERTISLPLYSKLTEDEIEKVCRVLKRGIAK